MLTIIIGIPAAILAAITTALIWSKLSVVVFGRNMLDAGLGIICSVVFTWFVCLTIWISLIAWLGKIFLIVGGIIAVIAFLVFLFGGNGENSENAATENLDQESNE
ncbi:hypothetical protein GH811_02740 [Acetobacterium malicum]|uniref:Uncharacterized protein n=1 Tax=Acetobacterium malicum TaxID=52692 RepID=A0ABR6YTN6_9FIRM|nr:hypothetical protein [Acetobacterium malicum]MBC3898534.1 hypothetical protein [Acetobacterium malicum]